MIYTGIYKSNYIEDFMAFDLGMAFIVGCDVLARGMRSGGGNFSTPSVPYICPNSNKFYQICIEVFDECEQELKEGKSSDFSEVLEYFYSAMKDQGHFLSMGMREDLYFRSRRLERLIESSGKDSPQA
jgi:hypothetical protein